DNTLRIWDAATGKEVRQRDFSERGHLFFLSHVVFSSDGELALVQPGGTSEISRSMRVYRVEYGWVQQELKGHSDVIRAIALSGDGRFALSTCYDDLSIRFWDVKAGKVLHQFQGPRQKTVAVAISPDNKRAISDHADGTVRLWDIQAGKELLTLRGKGVHY